MSTNCVHCISRLRTGPDLLCDECRLDGRGRLMLTAGYICQVCGADVIGVPVRPRAEDEGVKNYVYHVGRMCGDHHSHMAPACRFEALDLKLPFSANGIGIPGPKLSEEEMADMKRMLGDKPG